MNLKVIHILFYLFLLLGILTKYSLALYTSIDGVEVSKVTDTDESEEENDSKEEKEENYHFVNEYFTIHIKKTVKIFFYSEHHSHSLIDGYRSIFLPPPEVLN